MSIKAISRQRCAKCDMDTLHSVSVCTVCRTIAPSPSEIRRAAWNRVHAKSIKERGRVAGLNYEAFRRGETQYLKRKHDIATGRLEEFQMLKRPRSINSERRPVKPEDET